jgi:hypothetical protein
MARWEEGGQGMPEGSVGRVMIWQADRWVIVIRSDDDTHFRIAYEPMDVAEMLYDSALEYGMLSEE